jgi:hypothetical protein
MKKIIPAIALATVIAAQALSQPQDNSDRLENYETKIEAADGSFYVERDADIDDDKFIYIEKDGDETRISVGKTDFHKKNRASKFRGHIGGIGIGVNGFLTDFWSTELAPGDEYFDINTSKWTACNITLPGIDIGIARHLGIVSSLGLSLNNYHFDNGNNIEKNIHGIIGPSYPPQGIVYRKSKLHTGYLTIPVMLEIQIPVNGSSRNNTVNISGGVTGAIKLWSGTRTVFKHDGDKHVSNLSNDLSLNMFRYGPTARIGYGDFQIYGTAYLTQLFENGKGPKLYPFELGLALSFD